MKQILNRDTAVRVAAVAVLTLVVGLIAFAIRAQSDDIYESEARYALGPSALLETDNPRDRIEAMRALSDAGTVASIAEVFGSGLVVGAAEDAVDPTGDWADYSVRVSEATSASLVDIATTGPDPEVAAALTAMVGSLGAVEVNEIFVVFQATLVDEASVSREPIAPQPGRDAVLVAVAFGALFGVIVLRPQLRALL